MQEIVLKKKTSHELNFYFLLGFLKSMASSQIKLLVNFVYPIVTCFLCLNFYNAMSL